ncbi:cyclin [Apiospora arundinis]
MVEGGPVLRNTDYHGFTTPSCQSAKPFGTINKKTDEGEKAEAKKTRAKQTEVKRKVASFNPLSDDSDDEGSLAEVLENLFASFLHCTTT